MLRTNELIQAYLKKLCPPALTLSKTDFLARGTDAAGRGDMQGCGEFNPILLFSQQKQSDFDKAARGDKNDPQVQRILAQRNADNSPNRRVVVLFFRRSSLVDPVKWPCPSVADGIAGCKKRFWSDGEKRRSTHPSGTDRNFVDAQDTFACRFYQRIAATKSPCEEINPICLADRYQRQTLLNRTWDYNDDRHPIGAVKEYLPGARVELRIKGLADPSLKVHSSIYLTDDGEFKFTGVPECIKAELRIFLDYVGNAVVCVKGESNAISQPDFEVKSGQFVWHQMPLDITKMTGKIKTVDFADVEIKKPHFIDICDAYKSVWFGHKKLKEMTDMNSPICQINYPEPTTGTSNASVQMSLLKDDLKDRDVILHEYGHFIGQNVLGGLGNAGYDYNDDLSGQHSRTSKEHDESSWDEGHATFLSCALQDDPVDHDGYDSTLTYHLDSDKI